MYHIDYRDLYLDLNITPLREFISEKSFNRLLIGQIEEEIRHSYPSK